MFDSDINQDEKSVSLSSQASSNMLDAIELMQGTDWNIPTHLREQVDKMSSRKNLSMFSSLYNIRNRTASKDKNNHVDYLSDKKSSVQPQFGLFTNGLGKKVKCTDDAMKKALTILEDKEPEVEMPCGFQTGNNKKIQLNGDVLKKAKELLSSQQELRKTKTKMAPVKEAPSNAKTEVCKVKKTEEVEPIVYPQHIVRVKLSELNNVETRLNEYVQPTEFVHRQCRQLFCHFCKHDCPCSVITKQMIQDSINSKYSLQDDVFERLYDLAAFKLTRLSTYYPELINKSLTASNLYYEIQRIYRKKNTVLKMINQNKLPQGIGLILLIKDITQNQHKNMYYLELTDGWSTTNAVLNGSNPLSQPLIHLVNNNKIYIGCKVKIAGWHFYPINNVIKKCQARAIQILYNGTNRANISERLGLLKSPFFRPIRKCIPNSLIINIELMVLKKFYHPDGLFFFLMMSDPFQDIFMLKVHGSQEVSSMYKNKQVYMLSNLKLLSAYQLETIKKTTVRQIKQSPLMESFDRVFQKKIFRNDSIIGNNYDIVIMEIVQNDEILTVRDRNGKMLTIVGSRILKAVSKMRINGHAVIEEVTLMEADTFRETEWSRVRVNPLETYYHL